MDKRITVALAGNPNSGKTTIFNDLTGTRQHVGNYPGVTVEKKSGTCRHANALLTVVDLPGTYSLTAYSIEERVARNFIIEERPDVVVDVVDASNLERNLYLATQLMELRVPLVLAFNMSDIAQKRGIDFNLKELAALLGVPIVPTVGHKAKGVDELLDTVVGVATGRIPCAPAALHYGAEIEAALRRIQALLEEHAVPVGHCGSRWVALKLLEHDTEFFQKTAYPKIEEALIEASAHLERILGDSPEIVIADRRYGYISGACQETVRSTVEARHDFSDRIDAVLAHRILGLPVFLLLMYLVFQLTFSLGAVPMAWLEDGFGWLAQSINGFWPKESESALRSLLVDGIIGGVGGVVVFLPNIMLLFLAIAVLEDSGYMARAAFVMDHVMHKFNLHGKSFIPMLIGFGCSVPAIMATRTLESRRDRLTTIMVVPLMSCGARLPIYALLIPAFFPPAWRGPMLWLLYVIGIVLALASAKLLRATVFRGETMPFVMELPLYRLPTGKGAALHTWGRSWLYLRKAGTVILGISIVLWAMTSYPKKRDFDKDYDALAEEARHDYRDGVQALNEALGLPPDATVLTRAMEAERAIWEAEERHHPHEAGYQAAVEQKNALYEALRKETHGPVFTRFLNLCETITAAHNHFEASVRDGEVRVDSPAFHVLEMRRGNDLAAAQQPDPEAYAAAVIYLDDVARPYRQRLATLKREQVAEELAYSVAGRIGRAIEPVLRPMGFDWRIGTALIGAVAAKEVFVAQLGIVYSVGEADQESSALRARLHEEYTPLAAFCIMLFCLISAPCMATVAITRSETMSWKWAAFQWAGLTTLGWGLTVLVFQTGRLLGLAS